MIIFNTTFHVELTAELDFLKWVKAEYIPKALEGSRLKNARLAMILSEQPREEGVSYSLQFEVESVDVLESWYREAGAEIVNGMVKRFASRVTGFSTLMQSVEL